MRIKLFVILLLTTGFFLVLPAQAEVADCLCRTNISKIQAKDYLGFAPQLLVPTLYVAAKDKCTNDAQKTNIGENKYNVECSRCFVEGSTECKDCTECLSIMTKWNTDNTKLAAEAAKISGGSASSASGSSGKTVSLDNPLSGGVTDINQIIGRVIKGVLGVMGGAMLLMIVWGGFTWLTAAGNPERVKAGTQTILWAVIGAVITLSSYVILNIVLTALSK